MVAVEIKTWAVHIYYEGKYNRTVGVTFTEEGAKVFCKSFNACGGSIVAVPKEHRALAVAEERLRD